MAEISQLQHLLAVVEHGGFRRASDAIHLTQPALTKSVQNLEQSLGIPLLERRARPIVPTPFGEIVIAGARRILSDLSQVRREVDLLKGFESGLLMVGCDPYVAKSLMAPALAGLVKDHPNLRYEVEVQAWQPLKERLLGRQIDLHVGAPPRIYGSEIAAIEFRVPPVIYFCRPGHPLTGKGRVRVRDTELYPRIGQEPGPAWVSWYAKIRGVSLHSEEARRFQFAKSNDWGALKTIVMMTDSIGGGPREVVQDDLDAGRLDELELDIPKPELFATIAYLRDRMLPPAAEALISELNKVISSWPETPVRIGKARKRVPKTRPRGKR